MKTEVKKMHDGTHSVICGKAVIYTNLTKKNAKVISKALNERIVK